jgi:hypothetical protein
MKIQKVYSKPIDEGFYIYSTCACGDDVAIRMEYVETPDQCAAFSFDTNFARELANSLIKVADDYDNGIETRLSPEGFK